VGKCCNPAAPEIFREEQQEIRISWRYRSGRAHKLLAGQVIEIYIGVELVNGIYIGVELVNEIYAGEELVISVVLEVEQGYERVIAFVQQFALAETVSEIHSRL